jgi:nucleoid-associated protein YgaU
MSSSSLRVALVLLTSLIFLSRAHSQTPAPSTPATPAAAPAVEPQDTAEAKLAVVLRSYSLLEAENDQLKAAQDKLAAEKASLEAQLAVAKNALPLADQAAALHEQLRQTQNQLAALSLENNQLKTQLATGPSAPGTLSPASLQPSIVTVAPAPDPLPAAAPAPRTHVVVDGDTLTKISRQYYGTTSRWAEILAANRDVLHDEKSLVVGSKLRIP